MAITRSTLENALFGLLLAVLLLFAIAMIAAVVLALWFGIPAV